MKKGKKKGYSFTHVFLIIFFLISLYLCFKSSSLIKYAESVILITLIGGSIGWMIDKFRFRQPLLPLILILIYLNVGGYFLYHEMHTGHCLGASIDVYRNKITGDCKELWVLCYKSPPWYMKEDASCKEEVMGTICANISSEELASYNGSCEDYIKNQDHTDYFLVN